MNGRFTEHDIILMHDSGAKHTAAETIKEIIEWTMFRQVTIQPAASRCLMM